MVSPPPFCSPWLIVPPYSNSVSDFHFLCGTSWGFWCAWCCVVSVLGCICCVWCEFCCCVAFFWCVLCGLVVGFCCPGVACLCVGVLGCWCVLCLSLVAVVVLVCVGVLFVWCSFWLVVVLFCLFRFFVVLVLCCVALFRFLLVVGLSPGWFMLLVVGAAPVLLLLVLVCVGWLFSSWCCVAGVFCGSLVVGWCWLVRCFAPGACFPCAGWLVLVLVVCGCSRSTGSCSWFSFNAECHPVVGGCVVFSAPGGLVFFWVASCSGSFLL